MWIKMCKSKTNNHGKDRKVSFDLRKAHLRSKMKESKGNWMPCLGVLGRKDSESKLNYTNGLHSLKLTTAVFFSTSSNSRGTSLCSRMYSMEAGISIERSYEASSRQSIICKRGKSETERFQGDREYLLCIQNHSHWALEWLRDLKTWLESIVGTFLAPWPLETPARQSLTYRGNGKFFKNVIDAKLSNLTWVSQFLNLCH